MWWRRVRGFRGECDRAAVDDGERLRNGRGEQHGFRADFHASFVADFPTALDRMDAGGDTDSVTITDAGGEL